MKRTLFIIAPPLLFLFLGIAINIGISWWLANRSPLGQQSTEMIAEVWPRSVPQRWPAAPRQAERLCWYGRQRENYIQMSNKRTNGRELEIYSIYVSRVGWPFPALELEMWSEASGPVPGTLTPITTDHPTSAWRVGLQIPPGTNRLPIRPSWPGFLINTLIYAGLPAAIWYDIGARRRLHRRRRNACLHCGYARTGLASGSSCPECGGAFTS